MKGETIMSNTMSDTATTTIACPDWCTTNHEDDPEADHEGPSWPKIPSMTEGNYWSVSISAGVTLEGGGAVYLEANGIALTPEQAHAAGLALLSAASWAKDHQRATA
jgi:hypothetical protein